MQTLFLTSRTYQQLFATRILNTMAEIYVRLEYHAILYMLKVYSTGPESDIKSIEGFEEAFKDLGRQVNSRIDRQLRS